jgi:hypothetical protein
MRSRLLALFVATALALSACAKSGGGRPASSAGPGPATAGPGDAVPAPRQPVQPDVDTIGVLEVHGSPPCRHLHAAGVQEFSLTGPLAAEIEALAADSRHPVHVLGISGSAGSPGCPSGAPGLEVAAYSFTDGIYKTKSVAAGLTWHSARFQSLFGAVETVNVLVVDVRRPGVSVRPVTKPTSNKAGLVTSRFGKNAGARAAVNGGYFDAQHDAMGLLKIAGTVYATLPSTKPPRAAIGFSLAGDAAIDWIAPGDTWTAVPDALGAGPNLVLGGRPHVTAQAEGMSGASFLGRNPRTAAGISAAGEVVLATVDGRSAAGAGMTLDELARLMVIHGCERAMNLDGGGSTTMWIDGEPDDGVVNYPSDDGNADHWGERRVGNALVVHAP